MPHRILILGAGPAGLGAALALGEQAEVIESHPHVGGLCRTIEMDGAVFDLGGHSFHTPHPAVRELVFGALAMEEQPRQAWCFVQGQWIPYPFQKHFAKLDAPALVAECRAGVTEGHKDGVRKDGPAADFQDFLRQRFGAGITRHFMQPYNEKLWGADLRRLAADWTEERVPAPAGVRESFLAQGGKRTPLQDDTRVAYPARGGFGEIFQALARRIPRLRLGLRVVRIDPHHRTLATSGGYVFHWRRLISTLSLPQLLSLLPDVPSRLTQAVGRLQVLPVTLVFITATGRLETPVQRIYCPGPEIPAHKIVLNHNSSAFLRALPHHGILAEVAGCRTETDVELIDKVMRGLRTLGFQAFLDRIQSTRVIRLAAGYPVPTHERSEIVGEVKQWLHRQGIHTLGRFGEWAYINADEALDRGHCLGLELTQDTKGPAVFARQAGAKQPCHPLCRR